MLLLALAACHPDPADTDTEFPDDGCVHPLWEGAFPFPSNRLVERGDSATGVTLAIDPADVPLTKEDAPSIDTTLLNGQDGFSRIGPAVVELDTPVDPALFPEVSDASAPMFLLDVDSGTAQPGRLAVTEDGTTLTVWPDGALRAGAQHAIVLRSDLPTGNCFSAGPAIGRTEAAGDALSDEMAAARDGAEAAGLAPGDVAAVIPFTTRSAEGETAEMTALAAEVGGLLSADDLTFDVIVDCATGNLDGYCDTGVAFAIQGTAVLPTWQGDTGSFVDNATTGAPVVQSTEAVPFWLLVPEGARTEAAPLLFVQHGIGGQKEDMLGLGRQLAAAGWAVVAIDAVGHGARPHDGDVVLDFFGLDFDVWHVATARDNVRQTAADHLALHTLLGLAGGTDGSFDSGAFRIDTDNAAFLGQSLGGIIGSSSCAVDKGLDRCALNVPGGRLVEVMRANVSYAALMNLYFDRDDDQPAIELFSAMAQVVVDPGDPAIAAPTILSAAPARPVLVQWATEDDVVENQTTALLARAMGIPLLDPSFEEVSGLDHAAMPVEDNVTGYAGAAVTAGLAQFDDDHGFLTSGDSEAVRALTQILVFLDEGRIEAGE